MVEAANAATPPPLTTIGAGKRAPENVFEGPDGKPMKIADFKGKPVLVNFWATWCAPCKVEMPAIDALAGRYAGKLVVLPISQDMQGRGPVDAYWKSKGFKTIRTGLDKSNGLLLALKEVGLPLTVLYDKEGKEVWRIRGPFDWANAKATGELLSKAGI